MSLLAVIPARGSSKRLPGKNMAMVAGKTLLAHTMDHVRGARCIDRVVVSTEDPVIAAHARALGAEVPFLRPAALAADDVTDIPILEHALDWYKKHENYVPSDILLLYPVSPLRISADIEAAYALYCEKNADAVIGMEKVTQHPHWMKKVDADGKIDWFLKEGEGKELSQDCPTLYIPNAALYIVQRDLIGPNWHWCSENTYAYVMPSDRSLDINSTWDLEVANAVATMRLRSARKTLASVV